jgi:RsiW-degrading membrane proteinase PrsW (M82 family)
MFENALNLYKEYIIFPGLAWNYIFIGVCLAIAFGAIWLYFHWPPLFKQPWLWAVGLVSAFLTLTALCFIQYPLQVLTGNLIRASLSEETLFTWLLLLVIPQTLLSGLVQEGAKMVPMAFWWWRSDRKITPQMGLAIGAIAGAGFAILEAAGIHNQVFLYGWTTQAIQTDGFVAIAPFWERFFASGFHIGVSALVGYGLAKGKGWQFYLIAAGLHTLLNYTAYVRQYIYLKNGYDSIVQVEVFVALMAIAVTVWALLLRWKNRGETPVEPVESPPADAGEPPKAEAQP